MVEPRAVSALSLSSVIALLVIGCEKAGESPEVDQWHLSDEPVMQVGVGREQRDYQFHEIVGLVRLSDGRIVVANAGTSEVRFYDHAGRHLFNAGGPGNGPGEFRELASLDVLPADTLVIFDSGNRRISLFDPTGGFIRSWTVESLGRGVFPSHASGLDDRSMLVFYFRGHMPGDPGGVIRFSAPVVRYSPEGEMLNEVTDIPGDEWYRWDAGNTLMFLPFGEKSLAKVGGTRLYVGNGQTSEFWVYGPDGQQVDRISVPLQPIPVTSDDIGRYETEALEGITDPNSRARRERLHATLPYPDSMPAFASLVVDDTGDLWVEAYRPDSEGVPRWSVIDTTGQLIAEIEMPQGFEPAWIDQDLVLGVLRDEFDVESVKGYEVIRR